MILGLQAPTAGTVEVLDAPGDGRRGERRTVGYVPQKFLLDSDMPCAARPGRTWGRWAPTRPAVPLARAPRARPGDARGSQRRRFCRCPRRRAVRRRAAAVPDRAALVSRPRLLLLDQPLANLDLRSAKEIVALLSSIARDQRLTVLISAHDMNPLLSVMDRVVYLADGRAASGTTDEVVRSDVLTRLYRHHVDVLRCTAA